MGQSRQSRSTPGIAFLAASSGHVFSLTLPVLSASASQESSLVTGLAPSGAALEIRSYRGPIIDAALPIWESQPEVVIPVDASTSGEYSAALPLETGDFGGAFLILADEHQAYARYAVPFVYALMGNEDEAYYGPLIEAQVDAVLVPITVSVQGPSGYLKDWLVRQTGNGGEFSLYPGDFYDSHLVILPGDLLRIESPAGEEISLTMPELSAEADLILATVSGSAPPDSRLKVNARYVDWLYPGSLTTPQGGGGGGYPPEITLVVTATQDSLYLADFSDQVAFTENSKGDVEFTTEQGHRIARAWRIGSCPPHPVSVQVGGNQLRFDGGLFCPESQFRLVDAQGEEKYTTILYAGDVWRELHTPEDVPIAILPGDRILVSSGGETHESQVPPLTLEIDPQNYLVSGQAPPGARLEIALVSDSMYEPFPISVIVTATQAGTYTADPFSSQSYRAGNTLRAYLIDSGVDYYAYDVLPRLKVELYDWQVNAWLAPLAPYTLTLTTPITTGQATGYTSYDGEISQYINSIYESIQVVPGSLLRLESPGVDTELEVPLLTAFADLQAGEVSGQAPPGARLILDIQANSGYTYFQTSQVITASAEGRFAVEIPDLAVMESAYGTLTYISSAGNEAYTRFESPHLAVTLDHDCMEGTGPNQGGEITLELTSADGGFSQSLTVASNRYDAGFHLCFDRSVTAGDILEMSAEGESILTYTALPLLARHDFSRQVLEGWAPPGSSPKVVFQSMQGPTVNRRPWLDPDGSFGIDTSDLRLRMGDYGWLEVRDLRGNSTTAIFQITGYPIYLPTVFQE